MESFGDWVVFGLGIAIYFWWQYQNRPKINGQVICKFCENRGSVLVQLVDRKKGISGGKATGALLTGGASMLLTGLSRKQQVRHLHCTKCGMQWDVE